MIAIGSLTKEQKQKLILTGVVTLIGLAAVIQFMILKSLRTMNDAAAKIQALNVEIGNTERDAKKERLSEEEKTEMRTFVHAQLPKLVSGDSLSWVVREMSEVVERNPIQAQTPRAGAKSIHPKMSKYEVVNVSFEVSGSYDELGKFIAFLEDSYPLATIRSIEVTGGGDGAQHQASIEIVFLVQPESEVKKLHTLNETSREVGS